MTQSKHTKDDGKRRAARPKAAPEESAVEVVAAVDATVVDDEVAGLAADRDAYLDQLRRLKAEFDNYRKRVQRDSEQQRLRAAEAVVESLLPVMDNMGRAVDA
ncbi:MAG: nucleotide exchange factor GrpE, partial [Actinomycetes bacterium]